MTTKKQFCSRCGNEIHNRNKEQRKKFIQILERFKNTAFEVTEAWYELLGLDDILSEKYPFKKSFDEVSRDINIWYEHQKEKYDEEIAMDLAAEQSGAWGEPAVVLKVNDKVIFTECWDCFPETIVEKGEVGTITEINEKGSRTECFEKGSGILSDPFPEREIWITLEKYHEGLKEWNNKIQLGGIEFSVDERKPEDYIQVLNGG